MAKAARSVDESEIAHFAKDSARWWDEDGPFRPLHRLNPVRLRYIRGRMDARFGLDPASLKPFEDLRILDIGCGGGLISEPMARLGARVTGVDADARAIEAARAHAKAEDLDIDYRAEAIESVRGGFDAVLALEIVEHVADRADFIASCARLCRPGGLVIFSTLNRTPRALALGIVAAEYVLNWVPRGTHDWRKFVRPSELADDARAAGLDPADVTGLVFRPTKNAFDLSKSDIAVNYFMTMEKNA